MKCDQCESEATLHDLKLLPGGGMQEVHLCEKCATELGFAGKSFSTVEDLLQQVIVEQSGMPLEPPPTGGSKGETGEAGETGPSSGTGSTKPRGPVQSNICSNCRSTWADFRERGHFGCAECYVVFEDKIGPLLARAQEGGTHHVGKCPAEAGGQVDLDARLRHLRRQLADAVGSEQFERAAELRDQISLLSTTGLPTATANPRQVEGEI